MRCSELGVALALMEGRLNGSGRVRTEEGAGKEAQIANASHALGGP